MVDRKKVLTTKKRELPPVITDPHDPQNKYRSKDEFVKNHAAIRDVLKKQSEEFEAKKREIAALGAKTAEEKKVKAVSESVEALEAKVEQLDAAVKSGDVDSKQPLKNATLMLKGAKKDLTKVEDELKEKL